MNFKLRKIVYKIPFAYRFAKQLVRYQNKKFYERYVKSKDVDCIWQRLCSQRKSDRCFVIGNGPSLTVQDLELLTGEECFASNKCYKIFDKTKWRPQYYVVQDRYSLSDEEINRLECGDALLSDYCYRKHKISRKDVLCFPTYKAVSFEDIFFSSNAQQGICDAYTVTFSIMQIAVYLGYKEIYLLGMDHNYPYLIDENGKITADFNVKAHFFEGEKPDSFVTNVRGMNRAYEIARKYAKANDVKIYNVTRGGKLEVFPREKLEVVLSNKGV